MSMLDEPIVLFRDADSGDATAIPLSEVLEMQQVARALIWHSREGRPEARQAIGQVSSLVKQPGHPQRGRAVVSAYLMKAEIKNLEQALSLAQAQQAQQAHQAQQAQYQAQVQQAQQAQYQQQTAPGVQAPSSAPASSASSPAPPHVASAMYQGLDPEFLPQAAPITVQAVEVPPDGKAA